MSSTTKWLLLAAAAAAVMLYFYGQSKAKSQAIAVSGTGGLNIVGQGVRAAGYTLPNATVGKIPVVGQPVVKYTTGFVQNLTSGNVTGTVESLLSGGWSDIL